MLCITDRLWLRQRQIWCNNPNTTCHSQILQTASININPMASHMPFDMPSVISNISPTSDNKIRRALFGEKKRFSSRRRVVMRTA